MRAHEFITESEDLEESWKRTLGALGAATALTFGGLAAKSYHDLNQYKQTQQQPSKSDVLKNIATQAGIEGHELAQLLGQAAHETMNFNRLSELGSHNYFNKKYDPKYNPRKAKILGNTEAGDGEKYKGRGYLQITGRENYRNCGRALGLPLEDKPELLEKPEIAAKAAVWFWQSRVQKRVSDFTDTRATTKPINPGLKGLSDRKQKYDQYVTAMNTRAN